MTTKAVPAAPQSRLEPEPVARRDFLGLTAAWSALAAVAFAFLGAMRLPRAAVVPVASRKFRLTVPESLAPGQALVPPGRSVAIFREPGAVYAVSTVCTHLGCIIKPDPEGFHCPCHGSHFGRDGTVLKGPAPTPLPWIAIESAGGDTFVIDESRVVPAGTKVVV
jgi:cytochrome b6-f complex iron-sulfur subunit